MTSDARSGARVVIVGGGYSGAAAAVQLANAVGSAVAITVVELRSELGLGIAYSTRDPDHRLNGPLDNHLLDPARPDDLRSWCEREGILTRDSGALAPNGGTYLRRGDFGSFIAHAIRTMHSAKRGRIRHHRSSAIALRRTPHAMNVLTSDGAQLRADMVIIATGNGAPRLPEAISHLSSHPHVIEDPFSAEALESIPRSARVLLVGSGLTALDVISSLRRRGHSGAIRSISRHGARPAAQRKTVVEMSALPLLGRIEGRVPEYARAALASGRVRVLARALRCHIKEITDHGGEWQEPFDELRNVVWQFWPQFASTEKRRFLRHLRIHYDTHRFRAPPQNECLARSAEEEGRLSFLAGHLRGAERCTNGAIRVRWKERHGDHDAIEEFDAIVNCTGLDPQFGARANPFLANLLKQRLLHPDPSGFGFTVDAECRPLGSEATPCPGLRLVGPPTAGALGDPLGVIFIAMQIRRMLRGVIEELGLATQELSPIALSAAIPRKGIFGQI